MSAPALNRTEFDESFRRWNNVPISDLRGQQIVMNHLLRKRFEDRLPPWRRWAVKSNGRTFVPATRVTVRPISGIHIRTRERK